MTTDAIEKPKPAPHRYIVVDMTLLSEYLLHRAEQFQDRNEWNSSFECQYLLTVLNTGRFWNPSGRNQIACAAELPHIERFTHCLHECVCEGHLVRSGSIPCRREGCIHDTRVGISAPKPKKPCLSCKIQMDSGGKCCLDATNCVDIAKWEISNCCDEHGPECRRKICGMKCCCCEECPEHIGANS